MDGTDRDFEECWEHEEYDPEQDFDDDGMGPSRRSHRGGPPGRGAGPYDMEDDMDMPPGYAGGRGQMTLLTQQNAAARRRREGGRGPQEYLPATHFMEPSSHGHAGGRPSQDQNRFMPPSAMLLGSRHGHGGGSGPPRGPNGEPLVEYIDAEEYQNQGRERYGGGDRHPGVGGPSYGRDRGGYSDEDEDSDDEPDSSLSSSRRGHDASAADYPEVGGCAYNWYRGRYDDEGDDSDDEPGYPPSSSRGGHRASAAGRGGRSRR